MALPRSTVQWRQCSLRPYGVAPLLTLLTFLSLMGCTTLPSGDSEADLVLEDLISGGWGSRLRQQSASPTRSSVTYEVEGRRHRGDLYELPGSISGAGIVLVPGIAAAGKDDRRLVALARTLTRARFTVLVPDIPGFRSYQLRSGDVDEIADAVRYLGARPGIAGRPVGIFAISYAVAPAVLASLRPDIREKARFVVGVGGYYDLEATVTFFTTGYFRVPGKAQWQYLSPHPYGKWLFLASNAALLDTPSDRQLVRELAWDLLDPLGEEDFPWLQPGPQGQTLVNLMENGDREQVPALVGRLPENIRSEMRALSPAEHDLSPLKARLILLHGRRDNIIPYSESVAFARAVPEGQGRVFVIDGLAHVNLRPKAHDLPLLLEMVEMLLEQRDGSSENRGKVTRGKVTSD